MNDVQFRIDQLRKDKIVYATDSCAVSLGAFLLMVFLEFQSFVVAPIVEWIQLFVVVSSIVYLGYAGIGNYLRLRKIRELEKSI